MSPSDAPTSTPITFHGVTPVLRVNDLEASLDYYVQVLGFKKDWTDDSENKSGEPLGDWLDMRGILWRRRSEGGWTPVASVEIP
jgi:catechol 2,3-dioxygenase-like lactoylglutathione lyase family enzyme